MRSLTALFVILLALPFAFAEEGTKTEAKPAADIERARLREHVLWMAAPERKGRGAWPARKVTADYIAKAFADAGLKPLPGQKTMFLDKAGLKEPALRNVAAWLPGTKGAEGEHVILSAHYDHLGQKVTEIKDGETVMRTTMTFLGADDNASGVAALLEIARCLGARHKAGPKAFRRGVVFVAFDLEERNLVGSRHYAANPPLPLDRCAAFLTMDMLGRSIADLAADHLLVMGWESSDELQGHVSAQGNPEKGRAVRIGIDFQPGYSDYVAFKDRKIPYLFITSGACEDYHQTSDRSGRILWDPLTRRTRWCRDLTMRIVQADGRPAWRDRVDPSLAEIQDLRALMRTVEASLKKEANLPPMVPMMVGNYGKFLDKIMLDGAVTAEERTNARNGALNLFKMAQQMAVAMQQGRAKKK